MKHINIITCSKITEIPEWNKKRYQESEYDIQYNSTDDIVWDCVIIKQNLPHSYKFRCKQGRVIYVACEPPQAWPLPRPFIDQFDYLVIQNPNVHHPNQIQHHGFLSWTMGRSYKTNKNRYNYDDYATLEPNKTSSISIVTSNLMTMPGHVKRIKLIDRLMKDFPGQIDRFGRGFQYVDVKGDALLPYMFHICIENAFVPNYWTEKFADPILAQSVPIYAGCKNIKDYFGEDGYISFDINDYDSLKKIIKQILRDPEGEYKKYKPGLENLRKTLMEKENLIPFLADYIEKNPTEKVKNFKIKAMEDCKGFKLQYNWLRLKRFVFKYYYTLFVAKRK